MDTETLRLGMIVVLSIAGACALLTTAFQLGRQHQFDADQKRRKAEAETAGERRARITAQIDGDHP